MLSILRELRARRFTPGVRALARQYAELPGEETVSAWQLERFNERWADWRVRVPYFVALVKERGLPLSFGSWPEFREAFPVMSRSDMRRLGARLHHPARRADYWRTTGGSTAEPIQLPAWNSEREVSARTMWYARSWFGVRPTDPLFLLWGRSHQFGSGVRGSIGRATRGAKDCLLGYTRWSAYELGERSLREGGEKLLRAECDWIMAYSAAIDRFARVNADRSAEFKKLSLKAVIATAESFPAEDSSEIVSKVFGCPVAMEYGSEETGIVAHTHPDRPGYTVFWRDHIVEMEGDGEIVVTALYPRACPLVRYRLGDFISAAEPSSVVCYFDSVTGRCNDTLNLPGGDLVHSQAFTHVVRDCGEVMGYQFRQSVDGAIRFDYVGPADLAPDTEKLLRHRLSVVHAMLRGIPFHRVKELEKTIAGKTRSIIRETNAS